MAVTYQRCQLPADDWDDRFAIINTLDLPYMASIPVYVPLTPGKIVKFPDRTLLAFAKNHSNGMFGSLLGVDAETGAVFFFSESGSVMQFVNSDLSSYADCAEIFFKGAPYHPFDDEMHEYDEVCHKLAADFTRRDPVSMEPGSFWQDRIADVNMGDWDFDDE